MIFKEDVWKWDEGAHAEGLISDNENKKAAFCWNMHNLERQPERQLSSLTYKQKASVPSIHQSYHGYHAERTRIRGGDYIFSD